MAFDEMMKMQGSGEMSRPVDGGKVPTGKDSGAQVEKAAGMLRQMATQMNQVLQMLGPDTSQEMVFDKKNPAETMGSPKMADSEKSMKRSMLVASLRGMSK